MILRDAGPFARLFIAIPHLLIIQIIHNVTVLKFCLLCSPQDHLGFWEAGISTAPPSSPRLIHFLHLLHPISIRPTPLEFPLIPIKSFSLHFSLFLLDINRFRQNASQSR